MKIPLSFTHQITSEQENIVKTAMTGINMMIDAKAGSSKTTTMTLIAENIDKPSLYLAYNKLMQIDAVGRFPSHVEVKTTHALAYKKFGYSLSHKLYRPTGKYVNVMATGTEIANGFSISANSFGFKHTKAAVGYAIKNTVSNFEYSADQDISRKHVDTSTLGHVFKTKLAHSKKEEICNKIVKYAKKLWEFKIDPNSVIMAHHDTYLKLFQLSKPDLSFEYDIIYLDEAQDSNSCILDILQNQNKSIQIIMVGDNLQSIYAWRGAINALSKTNWHTCELSKSFRFGTKLSEFIHNSTLDFDFNKFVKIEGNDAITTEVLRSSNYKNEVATHIFRTNSEMMLSAIVAIEQGHAVIIESDTKSFISKMKSLIALQSGDTSNAKHPDVAIFSSWEEFKLDAMTDSGENSRLVSIIEDKTANRYIKRLENYAPSTSEKAHRYMTAHKSKGLEFDVVVVHNDFKTLFQHCNNNNELVYNQERNLRYVACTRAKKKLYYGQAIESWIWRDTILEEIERYKGHSE